VSGRDASAFDLPGGARVLWRRLRGADVADFSIHFRGLPARNRLEEAGLEKLLLQTIAEGLERARPDELTSLGAHVRFHVRPDSSMLGIRCLGGNLRPSARLIAGWLREWDPRPEDVERNRARMIQAKARILDDPDDAVSYVADRTFLPAGHPYLAYAEGTEESLPCLSMDALRARRRAILTGATIVVTVVGDVGHEEGMRIAEDAVVALPLGPPPAGVVPPVGGPPGGLSTECRPIPTCYVRGKFPVPAPGEEGFLALSLALAILHREMFLEVRTRRALTYAVSSGIGERARNSGFLYVTTTRPREAIEAMYETVDRLIAAPLPDREFRGSALTFLTRQLLRREAADEQSDSLALDELIAGDWTRSMDLDARIERLRPTDIQKALRDHLKGIHYGVIGPQAIVEKLDPGLFAR
jgi:zinc protease